MEQFDIFAVKQKLREVRVSKGITQVELADNDIISTRHLQRVEELRIKDFVSLPLLIDLANYYDVSIDYLLGNSKYITVYKGHSYKSFFRELITLLDLKLAELDIDSSGFFIFKSSSRHIINFFNEYKKILDLKPSIDDNIFNFVLENLLSKFDDELK